MPQYLVPVQRFPTMGINKNGFVCVGLSIRKVLQPVLSSKCRAADPQTCNGPIVHRAKRALSLQKVASDIKVGGSRADSLLVEPCPKTSVQHYRNDDQLNMDERLSRCVQLHLKEIETKRLSFPIIATQTGMRKSWLV